MQGKTDRLSRAASAIWRLRMADPDPMGDPSGDCGDLIEQAERNCILNAITLAGYDNPGQYNTDLRSRMVDELGKMTLRVHELLSILEVDRVCPNCGSALDVSHHRTKNYGGGCDTFENCPNCDYSEVYV